MGQLGFFDADKRLQALSARGDPLEAIDHLVPWESFRAEIEAVVLTPDELKKSSAGRKPLAAQERASALQVGDDAFLDGRRERIAALGLRHALPTMSLTREAAAAGSLMSYGSDRLDVYRARAQQAHRCAMLCPTISLDSRAPLLRAWRCRCVTTTLH